MVSALGPYARPILARLVQEVAGWLLARFAAHVMASSSDEIQPVFVLGDVGADLGEGDRPMTPMFAQDDHRVEECERRRRADAVGQEGLPMAPAVDRGDEEDAGERSRPPDVFIDLTIDTSNSDVAAARHPNVVQPAAEYGAARLALCAHAPPRRAGSHATTTVPSLSETDSARQSTAYRTAARGHWRVAGRPRPLYARKTLGTSHARRPRPASDSDARESDTDWPQPSTTADDSANESASDSDLEPEPATAADIAASLSRKRAHATLKSQKVARPRDSSTVGLRRSMRVVPQSQTPSPSVDRSASGSLSPNTPPHAHPHASALHAETRGSGRRKSAPTQHACRPRIALLRAGDVRDACRLRAFEAGVAAFVGLSTFAASSPSIAPVSDARGCCRAHDRSTPGPVVQCALCGACVHAGCAGLRRPDLRAIADGAGFACVSCVEAAADGTVFFPVGRRMVVGVGVSPVAARSRTRGRGRPGQVIEEAVGQRIAQSARRAGHAGQRPTPEVPGRDVLDAHAAVGRGSVCTKVRPERDADESMEANDVSFVIVLD